MFMELEQMITTAEAEKLAEQYGTPISRASIVRALQRGQEGIGTYILATPGAKIEQNRTKD